jgi:hypothetical protein
MKILAVVKFNDHHAFVFDQPIEYTYEEIEDMLIGSDESRIFYSCLFYKKPFGNFKAFAGRKFDLPLKDGGTIHCDGQYWDGKSEKASKIKGVNIIPITGKYIEELKKCYVYYGMYADEDKLNQLISQYDGKIYEYNEYEKLIKQ